MTTVITEFTSFNDVALDEAYNYARRFVEDQRLVSVTDVRHADPDRLKSAGVDLSIIAAPPAMISSPAGAQVLAGLTARQAAAITLSIGIAVIEGAAGSHASSLTALLGAAPTGASRWIESAADPDALHQLIVRWLYTILDGLPRDQTLMTEASDAINANLPPGGGAQPTDHPFWGVP